MLKKVVKNHEETCHSKLMHIICTLFVTMNTVQNQITA